MKRLTSLILATTLSIGLFNTVAIRVSARGNDTNIQVEKNYEIYPLPQNEVYLGSDFRITDEVNIVLEDGIDESTRNFIVEILANNGINNTFSKEVVDNKTNIIIGVRENRLKLIIYSLSLFFYCEIFGKCLHKKYTTGIIVKKRLFT